MFQVNKIGAYSSKQDEGEEKPVQLALRLSNYNVLRLSYYNVQLLGSATRCLMHFYLAPFAARAETYDQDIGPSKLLSWYMNYFCFLCIFAPVRGAPFHCFQPEVHSDFTLFNWHQSWTHPNCKFMLVHVCIA